MFLELALLDLLPSRSSMWRSLKGIFSRSKLPEVGLRMPGCMKHWVSPIACTICAVGVHSCNPSAGEVEEG